MNTARRWTACCLASGLGLALAGGCGSARYSASSHAPFRAHACAGCHDTEGSLSFGAYPAAFTLPPAKDPRLAPSLDEKTRGRLRYRVDRLCFQCHKELDPEGEALRGLWLHGPFKAGVCLACHDPHESGNARLLLAPAGEALCSRCHPGFHDGRGTAAYPSRACADCHSPHAQRGLPAPRAGGGP